MKAINLFSTLIWNQTSARTKTIVKTIVICMAIVAGLAFVGYLQHDGGTPLDAR